MKAVAWTVVSVCTLTVTWLAGHAIAQTGIQRGTAKSLPIAAETVDTMERAQLLMDTLRANDWDINRVDSRLLRVPDQDHASNPERRATNSPTFLCTGLYEVPSVYKGQVAFYSKLYVHRDFKVVPGIEGIARYSGFVIVGWMNGKIEKIPVDQVRLYPTGPDSFAYVFPGMREYDLNLSPYGGPIKKVAARR